jgi:serine/threonine-protein kinase
MERERARLAQAHAAALERLAVGAAADDRAAAVGWWRRLAAADPLSSRVAVELMKACAAAGEPEAALQHARVHEALVWQELETPPDPAVAALAERIREDLRTGRTTAGEATAPPSMPTLPSPPAAALAEPPIAAATSAATSAAPPSHAAPPSVAASAARASRRRATVVFACVAALALVAVVALRIDRLSRVDAAAAAAPAERSIAVLPFVDMSPGAENAYFGDGLAEELITVLSGVDGLRVAARTSSFALRDARLDVRAIGDTLGVAHVVEGSVRRDGARLRVTAQLIDARSGYHLWAATYDRRLADVFAVQDEIAGAIAGALRLTLADRGAAPARTTNREAYDLYLRGTWFRNRLSKDAIFKAMASFDQAIALDSGYALAYAGKASAMGPLFYFGHVPREPGLGQMRAAARRALELDDRLGEAHVAMGIIDFFYDWNWPAAEREFVRATELNPGDAHAWHMLANLRRASGRTDEAIAARRRSLEIDPLNPRTAITLGGDYLAARRYDEAAEQYRRGAEIDSMNPLLLGLGPHLPSGLGDVYEQQGRLDAAVEEYVRVAARRGATPAEQRELRQAFAQGGMRGFWRRWLAYEEREAHGAPRAIRAAAVYARVGDRARAIESLERAFRERDPGLVFLGQSEAWSAVRDDPRVQAMVAHIQRGAGR